MKVLPPPTPPKPPGDTDAGEEARGAAITQVAAHAEEGWLTAALGILHSKAAVLEELTTDDVWEALDDTEHETHEARAMGAVMVAGGEAGWIHRTDRTVLSRRPVNHRRPVRVWDSLIYEFREDVPGVSGEADTRVAPDDETRDQTDGVVWESGEAGARGETGAGKEADARVRREAGSRGRVLPPPQPNHAKSPPPSDMATRVADLDDQEHLASPPDAPQSSSSGDEATRVADPVESHAGVGSLIGDAVLRSDLGAVEVELVDPVPTGWSSETEMAMVTAATQMAAFRAISGQSRRRYYLMACPDHGYWLLVTGPKGIEGKSTWMGNCATCRRKEAVDLVDEIPVPSFPTSPLVGEAERVEVAELMDAQEEE